VAQLRPLAPGEPTWPELLECAAQRRAAEHNNATAAATATACADSLQLREAARQDANASLQPHAGTAQQTDNELVAAATAAAAAAATTAAATAACGPVTPPQPHGLSEMSRNCPELDVSEGTAKSSSLPTSASQQGQRVVVLLYGTPMSGVPEQAALLAETYNLPVVTIDGLLSRAADLLAACCKTEAGGTDDASCHANSKLQQSLQQLLIGRCDPTALPVVPVPARSGAADAAAAQQPCSTTPTAHAALPLAEVHDTAVAALALALQEPENARGFILCGCSSILLPGAAFAVHCLLEGLGLISEPMTLAHAQDAAVPPSRGTSASGSNGSRLKPAGGPASSSSGSSSAVVRGSRPSTAAAGAGKGSKLQTLQEASPALGAAMDSSRPDVWRGQQRVHAVALQLEQHVAEERWCAAVAAANAGLEAQHTLDATADQQASFTTAWAAYEQQAAELCMVLGGDGGASSTQSPVSLRKVSSVPACTGCSVCVSTHKSNQPLPACECGVPAAGLHRRAQAAPHALPCRWRPAWQQVQCSCAILCEASLFAQGCWSLRCHQCRRMRCWCRRHMTCAYSPSRPSPQNDLPSHASKCGQCHPLRRRFLSLVTAVLRWLIQLQWLAAVTRMAAHLHVW
jgi:trimeric autotransporter adhesin